MHGGMFLFFLSVRELHLLKRLKDFWFLVILFFLFIICTRRRVLTVAKLQGSTHSSGLTLELQERSEVRGGYASQDLVVPLVFTPHIAI